MEIITPQTYTYKATSCISLRLAPNHEECVYVEWLHGDEGHYGYQQPTNMVSGRPCYEYLS